MLKVMAPPEAVPMLYPKAEYRFRPFADFADERDKRFD